MDWGDAWKGVQEQAGKSWDTFLETGVPAIKAGVEKQAIDWLTKQNQTTQKQLDAGIAKVVNEPGSALGNAIGASVKESFFKQYQTEIIVGAGGLILVGFIIARK